MRATAAYSVETGLHVTAQERLDALCGDEADTFYTLALGPIPHWCAEGEHWEAVYEVMLCLHVTFHDAKTEAYVVRASMPMSRVYDGDVADFTEMVDGLYERARFIHLCGGAEFSAQMEAALAEHERESGDGTG